MNTCPAHDRLERILHGELNRSEREEFEAHAEACGACRRLLEELAAASEPFEGLPRRPDLPELEEVAFLADLRESPPAGHGSEATNEPLEPVTGRFRVIRWHDRGGLGDVFVARDHEVRREVALKQIRAEHAGSTELRARFLMEAEITGGLEHPGIVPVYGLGHDEKGRPYYAMRFIRGESLKQAVLGFHADEKLRRDPAARALALRALLRRFVDVCNAIDYAHSRRVVHRDIKPANILLGPFGETLMMDWGLAKALGRGGDEGEGTLEALAPETAEGITTTAMGRGVGTPSYMSPEQAEGRGDEIGPASDIYGLGATLYFLLAGRAPLDGQERRGASEAAASTPRAGPGVMPRWVDPALSAVCLKAMAQRPGDRYASARLMADDVEAWLADQPVSAWKEPWRRRMGRRARRHRVFVASTLAAMLVACLTGGVIWNQMQVRAATGLALVTALSTAETSHVPEILAQLRHYPRQVERPLLNLYARSSDGSREKLHAALALRPFGPERRRYLQQSLLRLEAAPDEVLVIRAAMRETGDDAAWTPELWRTLEGHGDELSPRQFRAAAALALYAPGDARWKGLGPPVARGLTSLNPLLIGAWGRLFEEVYTALLAPLRKIHEDWDRPESKDLASSLLIDYADRPNNPHRAEDLAALLAHADESDFDRIVRMIAALPAPARDAAIRCVSDRLELLTRFDRAAARPQAQSLFALARLGSPNLAWPYLAHGDDPGVRTFWIHQWAAFGIDVRLLTDRLRVERDASARRALILALSEMPIERWPEGERAATAALLIEWYRTDPDPGIHGAADWVLRRCWGAGPELDRIDVKLASRDIPRGRDWFLNGQGQAFTMVRGPVEARLGSPATEPGRLPNEDQRMMRIDRSFAIATRETTVAEYRRFLEANPDLPRYLDNDLVKPAMPTPDCPVVAPTWYEAARYCNWLSRIEGIPEGQWCYSVVVGPGMTLSEDLLTRTGYRMATDAEWEYACRAGAATSRPYGSDERWLDRYSWYSANNGGKIHPVAELRPNDLGLFDMLGNAIEWTTDPFSHIEGRPVVRRLVDHARKEPVDEDHPMSLRGGSLHYSPAGLRAAHGFPYRPSIRDLTVGFRVARTCP